MKTKLFKIAHSIKANYTSFSEALKQAWRIIKLSVCMKLGAVAFTFKKVDGSIRQAVGTLKDTPAVLGTKAKNYSAFTYYDIEANGWRSFKCELFQSL